MTHQLLNTTSRELASQSSFVASAASQATLLKCALRFLFSSMRCGMKSIAVTNLHFCEWQISTHRGRWPEWPRKAREREHVGVFANQMPAASDTRAPDAPRRGHS